MSLFMGLWLASFGVAMLLGVFLPKLRWRHGKRGRGGPSLSLFSQLLMAATVLIAGALSFGDAFHQSWSGGSSPLIMFALIGGMFIMSHIDHRKQKSDNDAA